MNILFLAGVVVTTLVIFGLPIWNLARLQGRTHIVWLGLPPIVFFGIFSLSRYLQSSDFVMWYQIVRSLSFYWLIVGGMLFAVSILGMILGYAFKISKKKIFWTIISLTLIFAAYAYINGHRVVVKELTLEAENISREYRLVHITDLHSGSTNRRHAQKVVDTIAEVDPEFVVITGDFIDESYAQTSDIDPFNQLSMPVYLITGNHEYYLEPGKVQDFIDGTKIQLIDDLKVPYEELDIIGVNELNTVDATLDSVGGIDEERYTILLDHQPITEEVERASENGVSLMLSGHTHKGQIWPMQYLVKLQFMYVGGLYEIGDMFLYVNQGTGTLGPMMRVGTVNEVTDIRLVPSG